MTAKLGHTPRVYHRVYTEELKSHHFFEHPGKAVLLDGSGRKASCRENTWRLIAERLVALRSKQLTIFWLTPVEQCGESPGSGMRQSLSSGNAGEHRGFEHCVHSASPMSHSSSKQTAAIAPEAGIVRTQAVAMRPATPQRTADNRLDEPTPRMDAEMT